MNSLSSSGRNQYDYGDAAVASSDARGIGGKAAIGAFKKDMLTGLEGDAPRLGQSSTPRGATSNVDLKDPIQIHLLTETALTDSKQYEILSQEDVDNLKKQVQVMNQRVESTRSNLAIQAKYRDAALSMAKLGNSDPRQEAELMDLEQKCESLALELYSLEKKLLVPQRRLLEHTAGILQLTHKVSKRKTANQDGQMANGMPGSPESLYTYSHSRNSFDAPGGDDAFYDDSYNLDGPRRKNAIEIPLKSPGREEGAQLTKSISEMEIKLRSLNSTLRDIIVRFNPGVNNEYDEPPPKLPAGRAGDMLKAQLEYLESGLVAVQAEQESFTGAVGATLGGSDTTMKSLWNVIRTDLEGTKQRKEDRRRARTDKGLGDDEDASEDEFDTAEDYSPAGFSSRVQWLSSQAATLKEQRTVLKRQIKQQRELNNKSDAEKDEELARKQDQLDESRQMFSRLEQESADTQNMLADALADLEIAKAAAMDGGRSQEQLQDKEETIELLEKKIKKMEQDRPAKSTSDLTQLEQELERQRTELKDKEKKLLENEDEMEQLNMTLAELKTEVTIARAELDGAYGSRAERAADVAAIKNSAENVKLNNQVEKLKKELAGTVTDLENVTKETLNVEREKTEMEGKMDVVMKGRSSLEAEIQKLHDKVAKLQEELDGERLKAGGANGGGTKGTTMLSEQFRSTMRAERKKFQEDLRVRELTFHPRIQRLVLTAYAGGEIKKSQARGRAQQAQTQPRSWQEPAEPAPIIALNGTILLPSFCIFQNGVLSIFCGSARRVQPATELLYISWMGLFTKNGSRHQEFFCFSVLLENKVIHQQYRSAFFFL